MRIPFSPKWKRRWSCLNETQLAAYTDGWLPAPERARAETHLSQCVACRDSVAVLLRSERPSDVAVPPAWLGRVRHLGEPRQAPGVPRWVPVGALACILLAAMAVTFVSLPQPQNTIASSHQPSAPPLVTGSAPTAERDEVRNLARPSTGPIVIAPLEGANVATNLEVRWQPLASAVSYEVRVLDAAGDTVWSTQTNADHLQFPAATSLHGGRKYFVLISASLPTGKTVHARAVSFNVEAKQENR